MRTKLVHSRVERRKNKKKKACTCKYKLWFLILNSIRTLVQFITWMIDKRPF
ncbi:hypothetical protein BPUM_3534 [Bacillus pumilus SAFR-032]|uniref:Uncharacterized protein n=1 Tax=Bacillus pumilus (strain SAFR-032) TaxID=315750 RepID=A8FIW2_BACP2|nr:hypothetical protein BPUM_3534 [Bacillus pumilus SAFR-032]